MTSTEKIKKDYEEAVKTLMCNYKLDNTLQDSSRVKKTLVYASLAQLSLDDIDKLNIIHVTGTKGKGSTCAFTENILRHHGYKTGMFTSPHIIELRERMRINGKPLEKELFVKCFWELHKIFLKANELIGALMPKRFLFLLIFGLKIAIQEKVDVFILEVGIGGEFDRTNIVRNTWVCGITNIGIDHVNHLGDTEESIAWHKAGIFKPGAISFVGNIEKESVLETIKSRAMEKNIKVYKVPNLSSYETGGKQIELKLAGDVQNFNASLALQIAKTWMDRKMGILNELSGNVINSNEIIPTCNPFFLSDLMLQGLSATTVFGRYEIIRKEGVTYYIDMAHNACSIELVSKWFVQESKKEEMTIKGNVAKVLVFDLISLRDPESVLGPLADVPFDAVAFSSSNIHPGGNMIGWRQANNVFERNLQTSRKCMQTWHKLTRTSASEKEVFHSTRDALLWASQGRDSDILRPPTYAMFYFDCMEVEKEMPQSLSDFAHIQVLVTGKTALAASALKLVSGASSDISL